MRVLAIPGIKVPQEERPRDYITETPPEGEDAYTVPDTAYYLRRINDGDLIDVDAAAAAPVKAKKGGA